MENPIHPLGEITLNGKVYQPKFDHYTLCTAEYRLEQQGHSFALMPDGPDGGEFVSRLLKATSGEPRGVDQFRIGVLLYAGIVNQIPATVKLSDVQQWITLDNWIAVNQVVLAGYMAAIKRIGRDIGLDFGEAKPEESEVPLAGRSDGTDAGPSPSSISESLSEDSGASRQPSSTSFTDAD